MGTSHDLITEDGLVTEEAIRQRAYSRWIEAGGPFGDDRRFWLEAKAELTSWRASQVAQIATRLWHQAGRPVGQDPEIWREAERQLQRQVDIIGPLAEEFASLSHPDVDHQRIVLPTSTIAVATAWKSLAVRIAEGTRRLYDLSWREFEDLLGEILEDSGWETTPMGYTKDDGVDIIAIRNVEPGIPIQMMVQCKRHHSSRPVGVSIVREVWAVKWERGFHQAMIATTSTFTKGAKEKAQKWNLDLRDHDQILSWCQESRANQAPA